MKRLLLLLLALLVPTSCFARMGVIGLGGAGTSAAVTYLFQENFEGAGYENVGDWTESGAPDEDYAVGPLEASQSLRIVGDNTTVRTTATSWTSVNPVYFFGLFKIVSWSTSNAVFHVRDASGILTNIYINASDVLRIATTGGSDDSCGTLTEGTLYYFWLDYTKGSGADAVANLYLSTTTTKPVSATCTSTGGSSTVNGDYFRVMATGTGDEVLFDKFRVDNVPIGGNPE